MEDQRKYEEIVRSNENMRDAMEGHLNEPRQQSVESNSCENCGNNGSCNCNGGK